MSIVYVLTSDIGMTWLEIAYYAATIAGVIAIILTLIVYHKLYKVTISNHEEEMRVSKKSNREEIELLRQQLKQQNQSNMNALMHRINSDLSGVKALECSEKLLRSLRERKQEVNIADNKLRDLMEFLYVLKYTSYVYRMNMIPRDVFYDNWGENVIRYIDAIQIPHSSKQIPLIDLFTHYAGGDSKKCLEDFQQMLKEERDPKNGNIP